MERIQEKLDILANAAKYDVSCASSGSKRQNTNKGLGNATGMGICHSYTEDGRCVSLLKILLTNHCIYDCAYCVSRRSNDIKRAAFTVEEVVSLTINFYRRNYIEGLFLSSGIFKNADYTMERLVRIAKKLREEENFHGYIHLKAIPGASPELLKEAGLYADRLSVNIELPTESSLKLLAPEKSMKENLTPMRFIGREIEANKAERKVLKSAPRFAMAGQSTQMIIGATPESDHQIIKVASNLYDQQKLKRVYYSAFVPIPRMDSRLPAIMVPPTLRENRLYQADWLMRFYGFDAHEIVSEQHPFLDLQLDPKITWALRNRHLFPLDINTADYNLMLRVPGIGVKSARMIVSARRFEHLTVEKVIKMGIAFKRAKYFITGVRGGHRHTDLSSASIRQILLESDNRAHAALRQLQLPLFGVA